MRQQKDSCLCSHTTTRGCLEVVAEEGFENRNNDEVIFLFFLSMSDARLESGVVQATPVCPST